MNIHILREKGNVASNSGNAGSVSRYANDKIVIDIENEILAGGSGMHYKCKQLLLEEGITQENYGAQTGIPMNKASNLNP